MVTPSLSSICAKEEMYMTPDVPSWWSALFRNERFPATDTRLPSTFGYQEEMIHNINKVILFQEYIHIKEAV